MFHTLIVLNCDCCLFLVHWMCCWCYIFLFCCQRERNMIAGSKKYWTIDTNNNKFTLQLTSTRSTATKIKHSQFIWFDNYFAFVIIFRYFFFSSLCSLSLSFAVFIFFSSAHVNIIQVTNDLKIAFKTTHKHTINGLIEIYVFIYVKTENKK